MSIFLMLLTLNHRRLLLAGEMLRPLGTTRRARSHGSNVSLCIVGFRAQSSKLGSEVVFLSSMDCP